ncbi:hypothetical protein EST38_g9518 [Candolleomyces aberdarensis]|uniref:Uncharacterized protein n=1 Tax=Candolleomyces aberdarensis TaxID=2316362 RepID=A0A4Q2DC12_9AGAR|nr:hypothetical protein EST38_g9518 [Candolleomyces aberdarensis]
MAEIPQTDVSRPSALPIANLVLQRAPSAHHPTDQSSLDYLNGVEREWNDRVDADIEVLVEGMVELVNLASIGDKDKFVVAQEAFIAQSRAESMVCRPVLPAFMSDVNNKVRAANSLLSIVHSLKLLLLLSDESHITNNRDQKMKEIQEEKAEIKKQVAELLDELLKKPRDVAQS